MADKYDYMLCAVGYQPASRVEDLTLIPKHRYDWMNEYFRTSGTGGMQMMRGTASTQVSIDYESEEDFAENCRLRIITDLSSSF